MADVISTVLLYTPVSTETLPGKGCDCWRADKPDCREDNKETKEYIEVDLEDIANNLMHVMRICRLKPWEVKRTKDAIKRSFRHYEEIRTRIDRVPAKRFNKENFIHDLAVEAGMQRMDGHLAYGIVKRAFRAYYHGTGEGGKRLESFAEQMRHRSECLWVHAAKKTAEIFAVYVGLMYTEQKQYEDCIQCIYLHLYKEIESRWTFEKGTPKVCHCKPDENTKVESIWDALSGTTMMSGNTNITTELFFNKQTFKVSNPTSAVSINMEYLMVLERTISRSENQTEPIEPIPIPVPALIPDKSTSQGVKSEKSTETEKKKLKKKSKKKKNKRDIKCKCPNLQCLEDKPPPVITAECSQGPYTCRWIPYEETFPAHCVSCPPMEEICPPCIEDKRPCDPECTCTCQICTCPPADEFVEEEHAERLSRSGLEDQDTDFCWLAPFGENMPLEQPESTEEEIEENVEEEELFKCSCTCDYKQRAFPHLFTHLEPFKPEPKAPEEEEPVEEPVKHRKPPCGISMDTYRCWLDPRKADEDEEQDCKTCPHITALAAALNPRRRSPTTVKGISIDVSVKTQHSIDPNGSGEEQ